MTGSAAPGALWPASDLASYNGAFRSNVQAFLADHATPVALPAGLPHTAAWAIDLAGAGGGVRLHVYREAHTDDAAAAVCDQCRIIGMPSCSYTVPHAKFLNGVVVAI